MKFAIRPGRFAPTFTNTSRIDTATALAILRFAATELEIADFIHEVRLTNTAVGYCGRCWGHRVLLRVSLRGYPIKDQQYPNRTTFPKYDINDHLEALAQLAGHEFGHSRRFRERAAARVRHEPVPKNSELEAEHHGIWVLNRFREKRAEILAGVESLHVASETRAAARVQVVSKEEQHEAKIADLESRVSAWRTKVKRATTFLKKYERRLKRARRAAEAGE